jgi:hypothetical protein
VSEQDRLEWERRGSPFRLMTPAADLRNVVRAHGYTVYDLGDEDHLNREPPEDHTPYSATGWPGTAAYGVGYAIDIMPPKAGARSKIDGKPLPSLQQLGAQLLKDRNAGVPGIRWLKYMNWEPQRNWGGPCYQEAWKPTYRRRDSSDRGHIHMSGLTGMENSTIGRGYDPVARIRGGDDPMAALNEQEQRTIHWVLTAGAATDNGKRGHLGVGIEEADARIKAAVAALARLEQAAARDEARDAAIQAAVGALTALVQAGGGNVDTAAILAEVRAAGDRTTTVVAGLHEQVAALEEQLATSRAERRDLEQRLATAYGAGGQS